MVAAEQAANGAHGAGGANRDRIVRAFASAKERGEAAFVTFVTAGYPTARGTKACRDREALPEPIGIQ